MEIPLLWKYYLRKIEVVYKILGYNQRLALVIVIVHTIDKGIFIVLIKPVLEALHLFRLDRGLIKEIRRC
jgi:hypothetical protein